MVKMAATALRRSLSDAINRVSYAGERIALERNGKAVAGIVSAEDLQRLEALDDRADLKTVRVALKASRGRRTSWREAKKTLGL